MGKVLEEFGKWFMNASLGILIALIVQPIAQGKFDKTVGFLGFITIIVFFSFGFTFLYLSSKINGGEK